MKHDGAPIEIVERTVARWESEGLAHDTPEWPSGMSRVFKFDLLRLIEDWKRLKRLAGESKAR